MVMTQRTVDISQVKAEFLRLTAHRRRAWAESDVTAEAAASQRLDDVLLKACKVDPTLCWDGVS